MPVPYFDRSCSSPMLRPDWRPPSGGCLDTTPVLPWPKKQLAGGKTSEWASLRLAKFRRSKTRRHLRLPERPSSGNHATNTIGFGPGRMWRRGPEAGPPRCPAPLCSTPATWRHPRPPTLARAHPGSRHHPTMRSHPARPGRQRGSFVSTLNAALARSSLAAVRGRQARLAEKAGALTATELRQVQSAATSSGVRVRLGYNHRFHPALQRRTS